MTETISLANVDRSELKLVGSFVQVHWSEECSLSIRQCEKCVFLVRGLEQGMVCVELIYDAIEGVHCHDAIYWVPLRAIDTMRLLSEKEAERRMNILERQALSADKPRD